MTWRDAHVGADSQHVAVRVTEEEKDRLEQLRRDLRLTSKGQVIRAALDLLEHFAVVGDSVTGIDPERSRRAARRLRRDRGVPHLADIQKAAEDDAITVPQGKKVVTTSLKYVVEPELVDDAGSPGAASSPAPAKRVKATPPSLKQKETEDI